MEENERQKSTARPWHINGASEAGRRRRGGGGEGWGEGLYSAAAPQWADTQPLPLPQTLAPLIGAEMAAVRQAISTGDDPQT